MPAQGHDHVSEESSKSRGITHPTLSLEGHYILGASIALASKFLSVQGSVFLSVSPTVPNGLISPSRH